LCGILVAVGRIDTEGENAVKLVVYAGAVWMHCSPTEVERFEVASRDEAVERLAEWLDWLSPEGAECVASRALEDDHCVLAGYSNGALGLIAEPPAEAEPYDTNRYGDTVYVVPGAPGDDYPDVPGQVWEPFYIHAFLLGDED
jgi:hypothetical protein